MDDSVEQRKDGDVAEGDKFTDITSSALKCCLQDWDDLEKEFTQLEEDHDQYKKKLEEVAASQKKCMSGIAHQRYRIKKMLEAFPKDELSALDHDSLTGLQTKILKRKNKLRELEDVLPHKNGLYLSIILGQVNVSLLNKESKYTYKHEYENFKLTVSYVILILSLCLLFMSYYTSHRWTDAILHFLLVWYYCTLTIRESILTVNGSRIKGWWMYHHFISTACAAITLIWPDGWSYQQFRRQYGTYSLYLACVSVMQYYYQKGCLYRLKSLGQRHEMDITVEGFMSWMFKGLAFLLPFLFIGYCFQLYNAYILYTLTLEPSCTEWQVMFLCCIHLVLFVGNMFTTLKVIQQKFISDRTDRLKQKVYKNKYRFTSKQKQI